MAYRNPKSWLMQTVALGMLSGMAVSASGQAQPMLQQTIDEKVFDSHANLRKAIIALGEARRNSCKFSAGYDCDLAKLSDMEVDLLDLESKYLRAENAAHDRIDGEKFRKLKDAAGAARDQISELADDIEKASKSIGVSR